jgi:hypothetical protein
VRKRAPIDHVRLRRSGFMQLVHILRRVVAPHRFDACFLAPVCIFSDALAQQLCGAQQMSGCKF